MHVIVASFAINFNDCMFADNLTEEKSCKLFTWCEKTHKHLLGKMRSLMKMVRNTKNSNFV